MGVDWNSHARDTPIFMTYCSNPFSYKILLKIEIGRPEFNSITKTNISLFKGNLFPLIPRPNTKKVDVQNN